jgi:hypothetical protein
MTLPTFARDVFEAAYTRAQQVPGFKTFRKTPMFAVVPAELPRLSAYLLREAGAPDGDANAGEPRFIHNVTLGFSGAIVASDDEQEFADLDTAVANILPALLSDPTFVAMVEGFASFDRKVVYSRIGETPLAEVQIEIVVTFRTYWPPTVLDDFNTLHIETRFPTANVDPNAVQQIVRTWDVSETPP